MQKKVGIRLRHLQVGHDQPRHPNINNLQQPTHQQGRKRQRSPSPLSRKKIFHRGIQHQYQEQSQQPAHHHRPHIDNPRNQNMVASPIMNSPLSNQHQTQTINNGNNQYQSQVERLIQSLKKKSIELERKQQIIGKLRRQIQFLKSENSSYLQQIKTLKAQIQHERNSTIKSNQAINNEVSRLAKSSNNQQFYQSSNSRTTYYNQPYEQFGYTSERSRNNIVANSNNSRVNFYKNGVSGEEQPFKQKKNHFQQVAKQQDSILSDYLSPLMVLNSDPAPRPLSPISNSIQKSQGAKSVKSNSRIDYNSTKNLEQDRFNMKPTSMTSQQSNQYQGQNNNQNHYKVQKFSQNFQQYDHLSRTQKQFSLQDRGNQEKQNMNASQNPFTKKGFYQQNISKPSSKIIYESTGKFQKGSPLHTFQSLGPMENKRWPTLQSSAAHFNTNYVENGSKNSMGSQGKQSYQRSHKQLAIEDSKQFKFEDFDFSQLGDSMAASKF